MWVQYDSIKLLIMAQIMGTFSFYLKFQTTFCHLSAFSFVNFVRHETLGKYKKTALRFCYNCNYFIHKKYFLIRKIYSIGNVLRGWKEEQVCQNSLSQQRENKSLKNQNIMNYPYSPTQLVCQTDVVLSQTGQF